MLTFLIVLLIRWFDKSFMPESMPWSPLKKNFLPLSSSAFFELEVVNGVVVSAATFLRRSSTLLLLQVLVIAFQRDFAVSLFTRGAKFLKSSDEWHTLLADLLL